MNYHATQLEPGRDGTGTPTLTLHGHAEADCPRGCGPCHRDVVLGTVKSGNVLQSGLYQWVVLDTFTSVRLLDGMAETIREIRERFQ